MAQQVEAQPTPQEIQGAILRPTSSQASSDRALEENAEYAHDQGRFDMGLGEGPFDSGDSNEKHHQEKCRRAAAEQAKRHRQGLDMTGKEHWLVDAGARAKLLGEVEVPDLDQSPCEIDIYVTVNGFSASSCWKGQLIISTSPLWLHGFKGTKILSNRRTFRAQDLGFEYVAPTEDGAEGDNELYSIENGSEVNELHRSEGALFLAWRDKKDLKLRELKQAKERVPSTPTAPNGSRKASSPDSALFPPEPPRLPSLSARRLPGP